jgi:hypothetical protein
MQIEIQDPRLAAMLGKKTLSLRLNRIHIDDRHIPEILGHLADSCARRMIELKSNRRVRLEDAWLSSIHGISKPRRRSIV